MAVMRLPFTQDQNGASQLSCFSVQPLGLINLVPTGLCEAKQCIRLPLQCIRISGPDQALALIIKRGLLFAPPAI